MHILLGLREEMTHDFALTCIITTQALQNPLSHVALLHVLWATLHSLILTLIEHIWLEYTDVEKLDRLLN